MQISEFQDLIRRTYRRRDGRRGIDKNTLWLVEEVGEFAEAVRKRDAKSMAAEAADVIAWLTSVCDLAGVDVERAVKAKYGKGCPGCRAIPCRCRRKE
jgi:NTP pyrophosphatase (non-canonical NTP hydrolase)